MSQARSTDPPSDPRSPRFAAWVTTEDPAPIRFVQGVGLTFAAIGTIGYAIGLTALGVTATALALGAALLNAAFGLCLGCEIYLWLPTALRGRRTPVVNEANTERGAAA